MVFLLRFFPDLREVFNNTGIVFLYVWEDAIRAVFDTFFGIVVVSAAVLAKTVERAVAEQTVKLLSREACVTGKVFALFMLEE